MLEKTTRRTKGYEVKCSRWVATLLHAEMEPYTGHNKLHWDEQGGGLLYFIADRDLIDSA